MDPLGGAVLDVAAERVEQAPEVVTGERPRA
jgi:hypothetical protein